MNEEENKKKETSNDGGKIIDDMEANQALIYRLKDAVSADIQATVQRKFNTLKIVFAFLMLFLVPVASYSLKILVDTAIDNVKKNIKEEIVVSNAVLHEKVVATQKKLEQRILFSKLFAETSILNSKPHLAINEVEILLEDLQKISQIQIYKHSTSLNLIVKQTVNAFIWHGMGSHLDDLEKLFPETIEHEEIINAMFLEYYANVILKEVDIEHIRSSEHWELYEKYLDSSRKLKNHQNVLPMEMLVSFHMHHRKKNKYTDELFKSFSHLNTEQQAFSIWKISEKVNPHFWSNDPEPNDFRISEITQSFLKVYGKQVQSFAEREESSIKVYLIEKFRNATSLREEYLGKFVLKYFYHIENDQLEEHFFSKSMGSDSMDLIKKAR